MSQVEDKEPHWAGVRARETCCHPMGCLAWPAEPGVWCLPAGCQLRASTRLTVSMEQHHHPLPGSAESSGLELREVRVVVKLCACWAGFSSLNLAPPWNTQGMFAKRMNRGS